MGFCFVNFFLILMVCGKVYAEVTSTENLLLLTPIHISRAFVYIRPDIYYTLKTRYKIP